MNQAQRYRISAAHAREHGDPYNADWLDEQADILEAAEAEPDDAQQ